MDYRHWGVANLQERLAYRAGQQARRVVGIGRDHHPVEVQIVQHPHRLSDDAPAPSFQRLTGRRCETPHSSSYRPSSAVRRN